MSYSSSQDACAQQCSLNQASNAPVPGLPYFSPMHATSPGTVSGISESTPTIFRPLKIRGVTLRNRICVSPMCQYSCALFGPQTGVLTLLYFTTVGHYAFKGAALVMLEATGVNSHARISVNCPGLYNDAQQEGLKKVADFVHAQGGLIGVQLSHAGRKSSTQAPWVALRQGKSSARAEIADGGWPKDVVGPSGGQDQTWDSKRDDDPDGGFWAPREMTEAEIRSVVVDFAKAAERAVAAGADAVEIHASHGVRAVVEVVQAVRTAIPDSTLLFVRISATDWTEKTEMGLRHGSWDLPSTIRLAKMLPTLGVDVLDVSSGGNHPQATHTVFNAGRPQAEMAAVIRKAVRDAGHKMLIGTVGEITCGLQARDVVDEQADLISVGRAFLRDPGFVMKVAEELGVDAAWPTQIARPQIISKAKI